MANAYGISYEGDENNLEFDSGNGCVTLWIYQELLNWTLKNGELYGVWIISQ